MWELGVYLFTFREMLRWLSAYAKPASVLVLTILAPRAFKTAIFYKLIFYGNATKHL